MNLAAAAVGSFRKVRLNHASDEIFDQLAAAIVRRHVRPSQTLPPERVLAAQFGTSRIIVRQAIHRLADIGLVRARQGGATQVLDPAEAHDLRVLELTYRFGAEAPEDARDQTERQLLSGHALVAAAECRATDADLAEIEALVENYATGAMTDASYAAFEEQFWRTMAAASGNRFFVLEMNWWYRLMADHPSARNRYFGPASVRVFFLREISRRLKARDGAARFYMDAVTPLLKALGESK